MKKLNLLFLTIFMVLSSMVSVMAGETTDVIIEGGWLTIAVTVFFAALKFVGPLLKQKASKYLSDEAVDALSVGVEKMYREVMRDAKEAAKDGKITRAEKDKALKGAWDHALKTASGPVKDVLLQKGLDWGTDKISKLIKKAKQK